MKKEFKIKAEVWLYPGLSGWHFVTLDKALSAKIRQTYKTGFVKVVATIGKTSWNTSLFPHKQSKAYLLCIKNDIRKKESIFVEDQVIITLRLV